MSNFNANSIVSKNIVVENLTVASLNGIPLGISSCGCIDLTCQNEDCQCPSYITSGNEITSGSNINLSNITSDIIPAEGQEISLGGVGREFKELHVKGSTIFIGGSSISTNEETGGINLPANSTINNVTVGTIKIKNTLSSESDLNTLEAPVVGDGYIISGNLHVYTENDWKNIGAITGPKGEPGETGPQGPMGPSQGPRGEDGKDGKDGVDGIDGINGADGKDGIDGVDGINGINGADGKDGVDGVDGINGINGADGLKGNQGPTGLTGAQGPIGNDGPEGPRGRSNYNCTTIQFFTDLGNTFNINSTSNNKIHTMPHPVFLNVSGSLDDIVGWPILPSSIGLFFNIYGRSINGVPTSRNGSTYAHLFPVSSLGLSCELLSISVNYQNTTNDDNQYFLYVANYGNAETGENFVVEPVGALPNTTFGSIAKDIKNDATLENIPIYNLDYFGLFISRNGLKEELLIVQDNIVNNNDGQIAIEPPNILIDSTVYLLQE